MELTDNVLEIRDLVKDFPSVRAVNNVSFDIKRNTVHCLVGENGAGKVHPDQDPDRRACHGRAGGSS